MLRNSIVHILIIVALSFFDYKVILYYTGSMSKLVLVIGGAGYIGSHVVDMLIKYGYEAVVFDDLSTGKIKHIPSSVPIVKASILNKSALSKTFIKYNPDSVIHLAAKKAVGESMVKGDIYSDTNIIGTINLLHTMIKYNVKKIVFSSTAAVYGMPQYLPIDEEHVKNPMSYYGETKVIVETLLKWYSTIYNLQYTALRYFNAAGHMTGSSIKVIEKNPQNLIPIILEVALGIRQKLQIYGNDYDTDDGTCIRDYIHVSDLAEGHVLSLKHMDKQESSHVFNLGTGKGASVLEVYNTACEIVGTKIPMEFVDRRDGDMATLYAKSLHAQKTLHWTPHYTDIRTIIQHAWDACKP